MKIHKVRSPFMSRLGQFESGKQTLAIGLDVNALKGTDIFRCYLGANTKCYYQIEDKKGITLSMEYGSIWTNPRGRQVAILPLKDFERVEVKQPEPVKEVEPEKKEEINIPLF
ncbi:MAG: hypothetical protein UW18_C0017G0012 [Microgenomates group bacterium GW2011_GWF1_44_10]|nr:MAG: hypothetical protein UW18_C0017G0012 [Microgenomates group bacterium GW2011_GWF1_44_10]